MEILFSKKTLFALIMSLGLSCVSLAQTQKTQTKNWDEDGEIENAEVYVEKDRDINLPSANRSFEKVPPPAVAPFSPQLKYQLSDFHFEALPVDSRIRVQTIKKAEKQKYYDNLVKAGIGNYSAPYLEAFLNTSDQNWNVASHVKHLSYMRGPVNKSASAQSENLLGVNGNYYFGDVVIGAKGNYQRDMYHFYGYNPEQNVSADSTKQVFHMADFGISLEDNLSDVDFHYKANAGVDYFSNAFDISETLMGIDANVSYVFAENMKLKVATEFKSTSLKDSSTVSRTYFGLKPVVAFVWEGIDLQGGVNFVYQNDTLLQSTNVHVFPFVKATYGLSPEMRASVTLDGSVERNSIKNLSAENPFLSSDYTLTNTIKPFGLKANIQGNLSTKFTYDAGLGYGFYKNMYFFVNQPADTAKFQVVYDKEGTHLTKLYAGFSYEPVQKLFTSLKGEYFMYKTGTVTEAWHKPTYQITALASYDLYEKIRIGMNFLLKGGIKSTVQETGEVNSLSPIVDLGLKTDYRFSDRSSAFINVSNILNQNNYQYTNYPSRGIQVMVGGSYAF